MLCWSEPQGPVFRGRHLAAAAALWSLLLIIIHVSPAQAMKIQKVVSPKGIEAWLVEDHTLPLIAMQFGFRGGTCQDPAGKEGLAYFTASMMDEGAGNLKSQEFAERLENLAIQMSFSPTRDTMNGGLKTLTKNRDEAFRMLRLALTEPRMDQDAIDRMREQITSSIKLDGEDPEKIGANAWFKLVFAGHPYANPVKGTPAAVASITQDDLKGYVRRSFARDVLHVAVVGDITAEELGKALDDVFGALPAKAELKTVPEAKWRDEGVAEVIPVNVPQSVVTFGQQGLKRKDQDFIPAYILNYVIGGGGFASKLVHEVREKRGLAYSVYTYLYPLDRAGIFLGGVATENKAVKQSIDVIREELARIAANGPTSEELENAKRYLTGSYALRLNSSVRIARTLLGIQMENLGIDYIERRGKLIEAVTLEDIRRVASRFIKPGNLIITVVGKPEGFGTTTGAVPAHAATNH